MKPNHKLALGVLIGAVVSFIASQAIHARQDKVPPGYLIAEIDVSDPTTYQKYAAQVPGTLAPFNAQYLVRGGKTTSLEGEPPRKRVVVIAFDSVEKARAWYDSPAYSAIRPIRQSAAKTRSFIAEGFTPQ
jgi:uncharacterized protein (DUF1330 family)